jgi:glycosyltransferase involved in cell wall biosynthesis
MKTVSLVFPAYNEAHRVGRLVDDLEATAERDLSGAGLELLEALVVDDGSADGTARVLAERAKGSPWIGVLTDGAVNRGKGATIARGVEAARGELVLFADVDLATPLSEAAKLSAALERGASIAIGSRDLPGSVVTGAPLYRKQMGRTFHACVRRLTGLPFKDTQCGFKLMPTAIARELLREQAIPGFAFDVELLVRATALGYEIAEVPISWHHQPGSRLRPLPATLSMTRDVLRIARSARAARRADGHGPAHPLVDNPPP